MLNIIVFLSLLDIQQGIQYSSCSSLEETTILSTEGTWKRYKYHFTRNSTYRGQEFDKKVAEKE